MGLNLPPDTLEVPEIETDLDPFAGLSPLHRALHLHMGIGVGGEGVVWFDIEPDLHWGNESVHGGVMPPIADIAGAICVAHSFPDAMTAVDSTIELKVNYLKRAREGRVTAVARMVHRGRRVAVSDVNITNAGNLCAKAIVTYMLSPDAHGRPDPET